MNFQLTQKWTEQSKVSHISTLCEESSTVMVINSTDINKMNNRHDLVVVNFNEAWQRPHVYGFTWYTV